MEGGSKSDLHRPQAGRPAQALTELVPAQGDLHRTPTMRPARPLAGTAMAAETVFEPMATDAAQRVLLRDVVATIHVPRTTKTADGILWPT